MSQKSEKSAILTPKLVKNGQNRPKNPIFDPNYGFWAKEFDPDNIFSNFFRFLGPLNHQLSEYKLKNLIKIDYPRPQKMGGSLKEE